MTSIEVSLNSIEKVKQFVNLISQYDGDFDLTSGRYVIDAKSIMGIFSLDLSKPLRLDVHDDDMASILMMHLKDFRNKD
ncbi:MAG: HPr family phosphocarrier protein [Cellulosilyticaceae bacterium]